MKKAPGTGHQGPGTGHQGPGTGHQRTEELCAACCVTCGRPVPSELIAAGVMKPAELRRRDLGAAAIEFATDILAADIVTPEDCIDPRSAPPRGRHAGEPHTNAASQDGTLTQDGPLNGDGGPSIEEIAARVEADRAAREAIQREHASDSEQPPLAVLGQGEYARTIPATAADAGWFQRYVAGGRA